MIPILYPEGETAYTSRGYGPISDAVSCVVTEEANGAYELKLQLPATSRRLAELAPKKQILARANPYDQTQPFRITRVTKPLGGLVSVFAQHISYDLTGVPIGPFFASLAFEAVGIINASQLIDSGFSFSTDLTTENPMEVKVPKTVRSLLGGGENTLLSCYGGELHFDRRSVELLKNRGADRGFAIEYGKNMLSMEQEDSIEELYTGVLPYYNTKDNQVIGEIQYAGGTYGFQKILPLDLSAEFENPPTQSELYAAAERYMAREGIGIPKPALKCSALPPGTRGPASLEDVRLFDLVRVRYPLLNVEAVGSVVKTSFDSLRERYESIEIGNRLISVAQTIAEAAEEIPDESIGETKIAAGAVTNSRLGGGSVSYGKTNTELQEKIDQIGVNKSNIEAIQGYFSTSAAFNMASFSGIYTSFLSLNGNTHYNSSVTIGGHTYSIVTWAGGE